MSIIIQNTSNGRLCNQIIRNLAVSIIAERFDLYVEYSEYDKLNIIGFDLYKGTNKYDKTITLSDDNYINILNRNIIDFNVNPNKHFFQTQDITDLIYKHIRSNKHKLLIIQNNPYKDRYNNNNDIYIHIRIGGIYGKQNPGVDYYILCINKIKYDNIYISTDCINHNIINELISKFPIIKIIEKNDVETIQFASSCKYIILSYGSYSAIIGYLSFYSDKIYYPSFNGKWTKILIGNDDIVKNKGFIEV